MLSRRAYNPRVLAADDLPNDVDHLKRLVLEHRVRVHEQQLTIERLKIQLARLRRWKFGRSSPGGHRKFPHLWPGQSPPPVCGGTVG